MPIAISIFIHILTVSLILTGFVGIFIPALPGAPLIFIGMITYGIYDGFSNISWITFLILFILTIILTLADYASTSYGAKTFGASKWGIIGAIIGAIIGLFFGNIFGLLLGPFLGATIAELIVAGKDIKKALKSGIGAVLGLVTGTVVKFTIAITMIIIFLAAAIF